MRLECHHSKLPDFVNLMSLIAQYPIVDETGLTNFYDFDLNCGVKMIEGRQWDSVDLALDPLGLELVPANMPIEMKVVEIAK